MTDSASREPVVTVSRQPPDAAEGAYSAQRNLYLGEEYGLVEVPLRDVLDGDQLRLYSEVVSKGYFSIGLKGEHLVLRAGGYVGLIPINDQLVIDVRPRIPLGSVARLLRIAEHSLASLPFIRGYDEEDEPEPFLLNFLAEALLSELLQVEAAGLHREYHVRIEDTQSPRGRILIQDTIRRHQARGVRYRVAAQWFAQTVDTGVNRCLKYAIWFLAQRYARVKPIRSGTRSIVARLNRYYRVFDGVELDRERKFLADRLVQSPEELPAVRSYYRDALAFANLIIRDRGVTFDGRGDDILMSSLLLNMEDVFERYLRNVLQERFVHLASKLDVLDGNLSGPHGGRKPVFDGLPSEDATPDIVFRDPFAGPPGTVVYPLLVEAKYKPVVLTPDRADLNQAITYAASYRAPNVVIAHPLVVGGAKGLRALGKIGSLAFYAYAFNLASLHLDDEEEKFCSDLLGLL